MVYEIGQRFDTPPSMMHTDPPAHTRYRELVTPGFRPSFLRSLDTTVRRRARALVAGIEPGRPVDVVEVLAVPFALQVISELLGIPEDEWPRFFRWSEAVIPGATDWPEEERADLLAEMIDYLLATAAARRVEPGSDIISELAAVEDDNGYRLTDSELTMFLVQLLVAGNETTRNMLSGGLVAFAADGGARDDGGDGGQWAALRARHRSGRPRATALAVEEMLRYTTPVVAFMRTATAPTELGGRRIGEGDPVLMLYASANRDETVFGADAERFDAGRDPNPHVAFGFGPHFCIGAVLARVEGRVLLEELLARFGSVRPAGDVERTASPVIAGIRHAPLVFDGA